MVKSGKDSTIFHSPQESGKLCTSLTLRSGKLSTIFTLKSGKESTTLTFPLSLVPLKVQSEDICDQAEQEKKNKNNIFFT